MKSSGNSALEMTAVDSETNAIIGPGPRMHFGDDLFFAVRTSSLEGCGLGGLCDGIELSLQFFNFLNQIFIFIDEGNAEESEEICHAAAPYQHHRDQRTRVSFRVAGP